MAHDVFISHSMSDRAVAEAACAAIERTGPLCALSPGEGGEAGEARVFLLVLSAAATAAPEVRREAEQAARAGLPIVLLRIEDVEPSGPLAEALGAAHWLDAQTPPLGPHLDYLTAIVGRMLDGGEATLMRPLTQPPQPLPPRPASRAWLPIALAGAAGVAAIAAVGMYVTR